jgi:uncharacterized protein (TIGR03086 family)
VVTARATIGETRPDQLDERTPCPDYDVRTLLGHMLVVFHRITALGNGDDPMNMPGHITGIADTAWPAVFAAAAHDVQAAWADSAKLDQTMVLPWVTAPGSAMLTMYTSELTVHTWDLAVATGQHPAWHEPTVQVALDAALRSLPSGDREAAFEAMRVDFPVGWNPPFKNAVPVAEPAAAIDRLVGWYGRQVPDSAV